MQAQGEQAPASAIMTTDTQSHQTLSASYEQHGVSTASADVASTVTVSVGESRSRLLHASQMVCQANEIDEAQLCILDGQLGSYPVHLSQLFLQQPLHVLCASSLIKFY